jgi:outer membrane protein OmpA-like peptidoglycan-associated protein
MTTNARIVLVGALLALLLGLAGCASMNNKEKGIAIGAGSGAAIGGVIGSQSGNTAVGAIIGAAIGGVAGGLIGDYMDDQAEEIQRDLEGARVERIGEGIKITFDSGILFDVDRSELQPAATTNLANLAEILNKYEDTEILFDVDRSALQPEAEVNLARLAGILNKYEDTEILIEGHTDATGSAEHNLTLSHNRANSVARYLESHQVVPTRFTIMGYGESQPIADNGTSAGRAANRRVELAIMANDKLKKEAERRAG